MRSRSRGGRDRSRASADPRESPRGGRGREADELGARDGRVARDRRDDRGERQLERPLDVHRDLRHAAARARPDRAQPGQPVLAALADERRDRAARRRASAGGASCEVERDERRSRAATSVAPAVGCSAAGPKSGRSARRLGQALAASPATPPRRSSARVRPVARRRARRRGTRAPRARCRCDRRATSASAQAAPRVRRVEVDDRRRRRARRRAGGRRARRGRRCAAEHVDRRTASRGAAQQRVGERRAAGRRA